jgi:hypothetical protein
MYNDVDYDLVYFQSEVNTLREDLQECLFDLSSVKVQATLVKRLIAVERTALAWDRLDIARVCRRISDDVESLKQNRATLSLENELDITRKLHILLFRLIMSNETRKPGSLLPWIINTSRVVDRDLELFFDNMNLIVYKIANRTGKKVQLCIDNRLPSLPGLTMVQSILMHTVKEIVTHVLESEVERFDVHKSGTGFLVFKLFMRGDFYTFEFVSDGFGLRHQDEDIIMSETENEVVSSEIYSSIHRLGGRVCTSSEKLTGARILIEVPRDVDRRAVLQVS